MAFVVYQYCIFSLMTFALSIRLLLVLLTALDLFVYFRYALLVINLSPETNRCELIIHVCKNYFSFKVTSRHRVLYSGGILYTIRQVVYRKSLVVL